MSKQISKTEFIAAIDAGKTRKELMSQFGLSIGYIKQFAKDCNIEIKKIKRDSKPKFILIDDLAVTQPTNQLTMESLSV